VNDRLRGRLTRTFGALAGFTIVTAGLVVFVIVFGIQARSLRVACAETAAIVNDILVVYPASRYDARDRLGVIMTHLHSSNLVVVVNDGRIRYEGRWVAAGGKPGARYEVSVRPRSSLLEPRARPFADRAALSLAALAGYEGSSMRDGDTSVAVTADVAVLKAIAWHSLLILFGFVPFAVVVGYVLGRTMARHALEPLAMVSEALEAFAAGDLAPRPVRSRHGDADQLDRLAIAYNAAMATMGRAFAERARAETRIHQFVSDASHQLRTPLTVLRGFTGILRRREFDTDEEFARIVDTMDGQSAIMTSLLHKLILLESWETRPAGKQEAFDVAEAVEQIVTPIAQSHRHRDVRLQLGANAFASIDPDELLHAIGNLVTNALNYAPEGTISVEVTVVEDDVRIIVADQGPGMSEDELRHVFDRFYRGARRDVAGSGLGLAIAKRAVERANGTLTAQSVLGAGSRFTIALPRAVRTRANAAAAT
jgi:signal transduction histidine kinase